MVRKRIGGACLIDSWITMTSARSLSNREPPGPNTNPASAAKSRPWAMEDAKEIPGTPKRCMKTKFSARFTTNAAA